MTGYFVYDSELNKEFIIIPARNFATQATKELIEQFICGWPRLEEMEGGSFTIKERGIIKDKHRPPQTDRGLNLRLQSAGQDTHLAAEFGIIIATRECDVIRIYEPDLWTERLIEKGILGGHTI